MFHTYLSKPDHNRHMLLTNTSSNTNIHADIPHSLSHTLSVRFCVRLPLPFHHPASFIGRAEPNLTRQFIQFG